MKNAPKYLSYTRAWERINTAIKAGFHLEAITIEESIISDRLLSYILGVEPNSKVCAKTGLSVLITKWRKHAGASLMSSGGSDIGKITDEWRNKRNKAVHGLVKSSPGTPTMQPDDFFELARQTAEEGKALAREIQNWHKKVLRNLKK
jgi:hypothetical protein